MSMSYDADRPGKPFAEWGKGRGMREWGTEGDGGGGGSGERDRKEGSGWMRGGGGGAVFKKPEISHKGIK